MIAPKPKLKHFAGSYTQCLASLIHEIFENGNYYSWFMNDFIRLENIIFEIPANEMDVEDAEDIIRTQFPGYDRRKKAIYKHYFPLLAQAMEPKVTKKMWKGEEITKSEAIIGAKNSDRKFYKINSITLPAEKCIQSIVAGKEYLHVTYRAQRLPITAVVDATMIAELAKNKGFDTIFIYIPRTFLRLGQMPETMKAFDVSLDNKLLELVIAARDKLLDKASRKGEDPTGWKAYKVLQNVIDAHGAI